MKARLLMGMVLLVGAGAMANDKVYRCGADTALYSHAPCASGSVVEVADPRTPAQQREGQLVAERDARLAHDLSQARLRREALSVQRGAAFLGPARGGKPHSAQDRLPLERSSKKQSPAALQRPFIATQMHALN